MSRRDRAALIAGLRELADFFEQHPDMPIPQRPKFIHCVPGEDDAAGRAEADTIARALGVDAVVSDNGSSNVTHRFGGLEYSAFYVSTERMTDYRARQSYVDVIEVSARDGGGSR